VLHPKAIELLHVFAAEVFEQIPPHQLVSDRKEDARLNFLTTDVVERLMHDPWALALKHASRSRQYKTYPLPYTEHFARPENGNLGRRACLSCRGYGERR
jgi:hypothetical protein